jgi:hypothetical protein
VPKVYLHHNGGRTEQLCTIASSTTILNDDHRPIASRGRFSSTRLSAKTRLAAAQSCSEEEPRHRSDKAIFGTEVFDISVQDVKVDVPPKIDVPDGIRGAKPTSR